MIDTAVPLGLGIIFVCVGLIITLLHAQLLVEKVVILTAAKTDMMSLPVGERVKVTGEIDPHPDEDLLARPCTTGPEACVFRDWTVEQGQRWKHVADGTEGVPALLTGSGGTVKVDFQDADKAFLAEFAEPPRFFSDHQDELEKFLTVNSDYSIDDSTDYNPARRCHYTVLEPGDTVTVLGYTKYTDDPHDPARVTIGRNPDSGLFQPASLLVTDWSRRQAAIAVLKSVVGLLYGLFMLAAGTIIAVTEYLEVPYSTYTPELILVVLVTGVGYVYARDIRLRLNSDSPDH